MWTLRFIQDLYNSTKKYIPREKKNNNNLTILKLCNTSIFVNYLKIKKLVTDNQTRSVQNRNKYFFRIILKNKLLKDLLPDFDGTASETYAMGVYRLNILLVHALSHLINPTIRLKNERIY